MHPIENIMQTSMEQIKRMVDVNTVVGNPIAGALAHDETVPVFIKWNGSPKRI